MIHPLDTYGRLFRRKRDLVAGISFRKVRAMHLILLYRSLLVVVLAILSSVAVLGEQDSGEGEKTALAVEALSRLQNVDLNANPKLKETILKVLERTRGTPNFVKLVQQFKIENQNAGLLEVAIAQPSHESGVEAVRMILSSHATNLLEVALSGTNFVAAARLAEALGNTGDKRVMGLLLPIVQNAQRDLHLRKQAARSLTRISEGASALLDLAREQKLADDIRFTVGAELRAVPWPQLKSDAEAIFPSMSGKEENLPSIRELISRKGDARNGLRVFTNAVPGCANCHVVNGRGIELGPDLSEIGAKLGKDALYEAILEPSSGVSFGFEAYSFVLKTGDEVYGLIASETAEDVAVKNVGGVITRLKKTDIESRQRSRLSVMPAGLQVGMSTQELVDLVEYLASLRRTSP
jgi:putative heme-binding domain-containing protein